LASTLLILLMALGSFPADAVEPFASYIFPAGGQRGTTVQVRVGGCYFHGDAGFELLGPGVSAPARVRETNTVWFEGPVIPLPASQQSENYPRDHASTIRIAADAPSGVRHWRVWTSQGATPAMKFLVGDLPEVVEAEQDGAPIPVAVTPPVTINGRMFPREDVDVWTFSARAGQMFTLSVAAQSLGSPLQARLEVLDPAGSPLAEAVAGQRDDPRLQFTAPRAGNYSVRIHDVSFGGLQHYVYRLTITDAPTVARVFPLGGKRGETVALELDGQNLPAKSVQLKLPSTTERSAWVPLPFPTAPAVLLELDDLPEQQFSAAGRAAFSAPASLNGRLRKPGSTNTWSFSAKKGDALDLSLAAARLDSPLTPVLAITDAGGKSLARAEATPGEATDLALNFKAPADGEFLLHVSERFASRGGPDFAYRLRVAPAAAPDFQLTLASDALNIIRDLPDAAPSPKATKPARGKQQPGKLKVNVVATGGFKGDIELSVEGLPSHVTVSGTKIAGGRNTTDLQFTAEPQTKITASRITIRGTATVNGQSITRTATLPAPRGEPALDTVLLAVALPTPFKTVSGYLMTLAPRGSVLPRPYQLESGGFAGPITVRLADRQGRHLQGVTGPELVLPPGTEQFEYAVNLGPDLELGRTSRSQLMLIGKFRDHDGTKHIISHSSNEQNDQVIAVATGGLLDIAPELASFTATPGVVKVPFRLRREKSLSAEAVRVELRVPAHVAGVQAVAATVPASSETGVLEVRVSAGAGPFNVPLLLHAVTLDPKSPHTAQTEIEFVAPSTRSAQAKP
jgi:hypothetical protein